MSKIDNVLDLVRQNEDNYIDGNTTISKYVDFSLAENIAKIDAYINSKHVSGKEDSMRREKPFFNIVTGAINIWYRATDIDRKHIKVRATKTSDMFEAFLATIHLQEWMRKANFGAFLNDWGRTLARYGSAVVKFIESNGKLNSIVVPWNRLIVDQIDFNNDVVIEVLELSVADLRNRKEYDKDVVEELIQTAKSRETLDKTKKDNNNSFVRIYEVHGEMPLSWLTENEKDDNTFVQQMQVVSYIPSKEKGKYNNYCLFRGREEKNPYMITHLIKEDGRTQSIGAVENLFESQWMVNHTAKQIKDQLDLASKLIFQTSDGNFVGQNALNSIETGDILITQINQPLTQVANNSHDITALQNFGKQWETLGKDINGISEAMLGVQKSGTAWRQTEALLQESHSLFEMMIENKANHIAEMLRTYVIPFLKKKMDTVDEITTTLESYNITRIDNIYARNKAIKNQKERIREALLSDKELPRLDLDSEIQGIKAGLAEQGNQRSFIVSDMNEKTWKEALKNIEWDLEIDISGENRDSQAVLTTLTTILQNIASRQGRPMSEQEKFIFNKILEETGVISAVEIASIPQDTQIQSVAPAGGQGVGTDMSKLADVVNNKE